MSKFGRSESAWRDTSVVSHATNRCSIWSTISTCGAQAGRTGRIESAEAVARTRALAGKLRPFVAELAGTARPTGGHAGDDRVARAGQAIRLGSAPRSYQTNAGARLHGCRPRTGSGYRGVNPPP